MAVISSLILFSVSYTAAQPYGFLAENKKADDARESPAKKIVSICYDLEPIAKSKV